MCVLVYDQIRISNFKRATHLNNTHTTINAIILVTKNFVAAKDLLFCSGSSIYVFAGRPMHVHIYYVTYVHTY